MSITLSDKQAQDIIAALAHDSPPLRRMGVRIALQRVVEDQKPENHICAFNRIMDDTCAVCGNPVAPHTATTSAKSDTR